MQRFSEHAFSQKISNTQIEKAEVFFFSEIICLIGKEEDRRIDSIAPGDADRWRLSLLGGKKPKADNTVRRSCGLAKQFFKRAVRQRLISENPFVDLVAVVRGNDARFHFNSRDVAEKVIKACPDAEWRLLFALARCPNGWHLLYQIDLPANDGELIRRCLQSLAADFDDNRVKIDVSVFNPARIVKLAGTLVCKGDSTEDRPHRMARVISIPKHMETISVEMLEQTASRMKSEAESNANNGVVERTCR